jgi:hypothetical protein
MQFMEFYRFRLLDLYDEDHKSRSILGGQVHIANGTVIIKWRPTSPIFLASGGVIALSDRGGDGILSKESTGAVKRLRLGCPLGFSPCMRRTSTRRCLIGKDEASS